jgi:hypothetical protein
MVMGLTLSGSLNSDQSYILVLDEGVERSTEVESLVRGEEEGVKVGRTRWHWILLQHTQ